MSINQNITAILYDKTGKVLSVGKNSYIKTHPLQAHYAKIAGQPGRIFLHAEIAAIIKCRDLDRAHRMMVTRFGADGKPLLAKPCPVCDTAIRASGIRHVDFSF